MASVCIQLFRTNMNKKNASDFYCEKCLFRCCKLSEWTRHIATSKHNKPNAEKTPNTTKFICEKCDVICCKLSNWNMHIMSNNHIHGPKKRQTIFACKKCNKEYKSRNSLWYHETKCETSSFDRVLNENVELRSFIVEQTNTIETIMTKNTENLNKTLELYKPIHTNTTINQTTNNNQKFNINVFLNETCKDAINFSDFIKNIQISYEDLENNAQLGFVGGISKIFSDNLKQLDISNRPIHCTDVKRETIYIKDDNTWTKQPDDDKLQKAIQTVSYRSMGKLAEWKQENPDYKDCNSEFSQKCLDIHRHTLAGSDRQVYYPKVIHVLARETIIENKGGGKIEL